MRRNLYLGETEMTIRVEEKSLEMALVKAAGQLGVAQSHMEYKVLNESAGFLGLFGKKVALEAWKKEKQTRGSKNKSQRSRNPRLEAKREQNPHVEKRVLSESEVEDLSEDLRLFCEGICSQIDADGEVSVNKVMDGNRLVLDIQSDYLAAQIMKNAKLAEALEHILRKKPRHLRQELPFRIFVDCNGVRRHREQELVTMAQDLSAKVSENRRPIVLNYRSSYDRKIIHMALDQDDKVYTKSIGSGPNRKLMILPVKGEVLEVAEEINA